MYGACVGFECILLVGWGEEGGGGTDLTNTYLSPSQSLLTYIPPIHTSNPINHHSCNARMAELFISTEEIRGIVQQTGFACTAFFAKCVIA